MSNLIRTAAAIIKRSRNMDKPSAPVGDEGGVRETQNAENVRKGFGLSSIAVNPRVGGGAAPAAHSERGDD